MNTIASNKMKILIATVLAVGVFAGLVQFSFATSAQSASGWAWGGTPSTDGAYQGVGWVSFNDTNAGSGGGTYGVDIPSGDGVLSGHAWSEHYGWFSFNGADLAGCAPALLPATRSGNNIIGGARILAIKDAVAAGNAGGFDGCVSLNGVSVAGGNLSGYAWSSDLGWIDMSGVVVTYPASPNLISQNLSLSAGPYTQGVAINLSAQVRNSGTADTPIGFFDDFTYQWNGTGGAWQNFPGNTVAHGVLVQGSAEPDGPVTFTPAVAGDLYIQHCVDSTHVIAEGADETPNCTVVGPFTVTAPPPTVTLNAAGCTILAGNSSCNGNVDWTFSNVPAPQNYLVTNTDTNAWTSNLQISGGTIQRPLQYGSNHITASANGISDTKIVSAVCDTNTAWHNGRCAPPPSLTVTANPQLIRSGATTTISIDITSANLLHCFVYNAQATTYTFDHNPLTTPAHYVYTIPTKTLTAKQLVSVKCDDTVTGLSGTGEATVEVVPAIQEI